MYSPVSRSRDKTRSRSSSRSAMTLSSPTRTIASWLSALPVPLSHENSRMQAHSSGSRQRQAKERPAGGSPERSHPTKGALTFGGARFAAPRAFVFFGGGGGDGATAGVVTLPGDI